MVIACKDIFAFKALSDEDDVHVQGGPAVSSNSVRTGKCRASAFLQHSAIHADLCDLWQTLGVMTNDSARILIRYCVITLKIGPC